jgi:Uma2 family endonuclease
MLRAFAEQPGFRLTYDRGTLEIMSPLWEHEGSAYLLGRLVDALTEELGMSVRAGRTVTLRRRRLRRGLEPDNCYWLANEARVRGKTRLDLRTDPPPDLAIEVDVASSSLNRMSIYAALGVPEVWRVDAQGLTFNVLVARSYQVRPTSLAFPQLTPADLIPFLARLGEDETTILRGFRAWVRQHLLGGAAPAQPPSP